MINLEYISGIVLRSNNETVEIRNLIDQIDIYQNINEPIVTGSLILRDTPSSRISKLFKDGVLGKGEEITFELKTATSPASRPPELSLQKYYVYKSTVIPMNSVGGGNAKQTIVLDFASSYIFLNEFKKITNFYYDTISNIASTIAKDYLDIEIEDLEDTEEKQFIIIPNLSPLQSIMWLTTRAYSSTKNQNNTINISVNKNNEIVNNNYVFYEDIEHNFHFRSLGSMFLKEPVIGKVGDDGLFLQLRRQNHITSYEGSYSVIQHITKPISPLSNLKNGMYSSSCLTFDLTRKKYAKSTMRYDELFKKQNHFYDKQLVDPTLDPSLNILNNVYDHPETVLKYHAKSSYLFSPKENPLNGNTPVNNVEKWSLQRNASMEAMDQEGIDLELRGNVGLQLGDVVLFNKQKMNSSIPTQFSNEVENMFTGKYLITKIKHSLQYNGDNLGFILRTFLSLRRDCEYAGGI